MDKEKLNFVSTRVFVCEDKEKKGCPKMRLIEQNKAGEILKEPFLSVLVQTVSKDKDGNGVNLNLLTFDKTLIEKFQNGTIKPHYNLAIMNGKIRDGKNDISVKMDNVFFQTYIDALKKTQDNIQFEYGNVCLFGHPVDKGTNLDEAKVNFLVMEKDKEGKTKTAFVKLNLTDERQQNLFHSILDKNQTLEKAYVILTGTVQKDGSINLKNIQVEKDAYTLSKLYSKTEKSVQKVEEIQLPSQSEEKNEEIITEERIF